MPGWSATTAPRSSSWRSTRPARPTPRQRKVEICARAYDLLVAEGFPPEDIIFDPNIFAVATGIDEHRRYALDFIEACREIKARCPHVHLSGGLSNLSFSLPRQRAGAPRDALGLPLPRHSRRARHGDRQCRPARRLRHDRPGTARGLRGRDPRPRAQDGGDATERLVTLAEKYLGSRSGAREGRGRMARLGRSRSGSSMRWSRASTPSSSRIPRRRG